MTRTSFPIHILSTGRAGGSKENMPPAATKISNLPPPSLLLASIITGSQIDRPLDHSYASRELELKRDQYVMSVVSTSSLRVPRVNDEYIASG